VRLAHRREEARRRSTAGRARRCLSHALAAGILAAPPGSPAAEPRAAWTANDISVVQAASGHEAAVSTRFEIGSNGDARISVGLHDAAHTRGTILLIGGRWMLTHGFSPTSGNEIRAMDVAALNSQLVIVLLTAALPKGPPPRGTPRQVLVTEKNNPIRIATETASAEYGAPWTVDGTVSLPAADAPVTYHLSFTWSAQEHQTTRIFAGTVSDAESELSLPDSMKLAGWTVREIGPRRPSPSEGSATGGGSLPSSPKVATVGELRRLP
jgi:hypothetical protein